jgi:anthraniloyl-CoA monooxygenase
MRCDRVAVLGAGPGGLYAARLLRLAQPRCEVTVYEQREPDTTFGFGVGLGARTQRNLEAADPDTLHDILALGRPHDMTLRVGDRLARVQSDSLIGVARTELLAVLQRHAEKAGVRLEFGRRHSVDELHADLVIAADGVSSETREAGDFGADSDIGRGLFMWCGAELAIDNAVFAPAESEFGTFVTHAYPYSAQRSTFLIETDERTWRRAGFDTTTANTPGDASDTASLSFLSELFREHLLGHPLIGNRTRWSRFRTVRCARWSSGRTVLLGDAAHTAHFSIGSGTKLAMEDAIALVDAITGERDLGHALRRYEQVRRPAVERLQELARRSQLWWESFPGRTDLPVEQLMVAYMTRAGNVPLERFAMTNPGIVRSALGQFAGAPAPSLAAADVTTWVLAQPLHRNGVSFRRRLLGTQDRGRVAVRGRRDAATTGAVVFAPVTDTPTDPCGSSADAVVMRARNELDGGVDGFWLSAGERASLLSALDLAERLRRETGSLVLVSGPEPLLPDLAAGLLSGRTDLVAIDEEIRR